MTKLYNKKGQPITLQEAVEWWLEQYEGLEHLTEGGITSPETWYTINTILRRNMEKIKRSMEKIKGAK